jgi:hypothetical protein
MSGRRTTTPAERDDRVTAEERRALGSLGRAVDLERVRLHRRAADSVRGVVLALSGNRAVALGNHVFLPDHCRSELPVLAHELTHCAQYQRWGPVIYYARGIADRARELAHSLLGLGSSPYDYQPDPARPFQRYGMEQQGQIVEDCFRGDSAAAAISPFQPAARLTAPPMQATKASTSCSEVSNAVIQRTSDVRSSQT